MVKLSTLDCGRHVFFSISLLLAFITRAQAARDIYGYSCISAASTYNFGCPDVDGYTDSACLCENAAYMGTVAYCIQQYSPNNKVLIIGIDALSENCPTPISWRQFEIYSINATRFIDALNEQVDPEANQTVPFKIPEPLIKSYIDSNVAYYKFTDNNTYMGSGLLGFFALVFLGKVVNNIIYTRMPNVLLMFDNRVSRLFRKHVLLPACFNKKHRVGHRFCGMEFNLPTRAETIIIIAFQILHIILLCVGYNINSSNMIYPTKQITVSAYIGMRSGVLMVAQLPLVFLFGARNNLLIWLTGWPYDVFNMFHRWITRGVIVDILVHGIAYSLMAYYYGDYRGSWDELYWRWGVVAAVAGGLMGIQSLGPIRHACYQAFLYIHIPLAIAFVIGAWKHMERVGQLPYVYASVAVWAFDRLIRWFRLLWTGGFCDGEAKLHEGGVMELTIETAGRWTWKPGHYGYIHMSRWHKLWQSRPFTVIGSIDPEKPRQVKVFAKARGMMTQSSWNYFKRHPHAMTNTKVLLEGPYGISYPLHNYDSVVLIAGGIGVTATYGYALDIRNRANRHCKVTFIWVIADASPLEWFKDHLEYIRSDDRFEIQIYVNNPNDTLEDLTNTVNENNEKQIPAKQNPFSNKHTAGGVAMTVQDAGSTESLTYGAGGSNSSSKSNTIKPSYARPNIRWMVFQHIMRASGTVGFMACGPSSLSDEIRIAVAENIMSANSRVDYFEEAFSF